MNKGNLHNTDKPCENERTYGIIIVYNIYLNERVWNEWMCHTYMKRIAAPLHAENLNGSLTWRRISTPSLCIEVDSSVNCSMQCNITGKGYMNECESNRDSAKEVKEG